VFESIHLLQSILEAQDSINQEILSRLKVDVEFLKDISARLLDSLPKAE
jgi:ATP-dependent Clp protease ATP-binding subunit ClpA